MHNVLTKPRHALALCLAAALLLTSLVLPSYAAELTGAGTEADPYQIATEADLIAFREKVNNGETGAHAKLTADIALTSKWTPIGTKAQPYTGTFDGDNHGITGFDTEWYAPLAALFGFSSGTIQNLTVETKSNLYGGDYTAAICAVNRGVIRNCTSKGSLYGYVDKAFVGGIAAVNFGTIERCTNDAYVGGIGSELCTGGIAGVSAAGTVKDCVSNGGVSAYSSLSTAANSELCSGGIVGLNYKSTVERCTNNAQLSTDSSSAYTGGVAGLNNGIVKDSMNSAKVTGSGFSGGVVGYLFTNSDTGMTAQVRDTLDVGGNVVYGKNEGGSAVNNYYQSSSGTGGAGQIAVSDEQLASGEVAYRLNSSGSSADSVWGQKLGTGGDSVPVVGSSDKVYATYQDGAVTDYSNERGHEHQFDETGKCTVDGCGYESVKLDGYTLTLDGAIGVTFYYEIDPMYLTEADDVSVTFTMDGKQTVVPLDEGYSYRSNDGKLMYGFKMYEDSGKMTHAITPTLNITGGHTVSLRDTETYSVYNYLKTIVSDTSGTYSEQLVQLAKAMATYDHYASVYFGYGTQDSGIELLSLNGVTADTLVPYKQVTAPATDGSYTVKHYGSNLYLQESIFPRYLVTATGEESDLYMGYRELGSGQLYTYVKAVKSGSYYTGSAAKRPASKLGTTYEIAFFVKDGDSYRRVSPIKQASVYSYAYTALTSSAASSEIKPTMQALYLYGEAAKTYFATVQ